MIEINSRVGVWADSDEDTVTIIGYGRYIGESDDSPAGYRGSKVILDNGGVIWGNEGKGLLIGLEQSMIKKIDGRTLKFMTPEEFRRPAVVEPAPVPTPPPAPTPKKKRGRRK